ncbi:glycosyltransferase family protein [Paenibacillus sp. D2_2]|uniref:glycosyltransferase family protein n=1 Tax=Paenibacillus sp. D2_2 TaxID=3073092 RepID=UPI00281623C9|nr:glycosyltransferase family protein [Paenibacillus sp. D2_2]WMT43511.1 glycosyltransferase family protein [Paenibacillus sp. D2_2]
MQPNTILFIICINDESIYQQARRQIDNLLVPPGFTVEVMPIRQASSMTSAYNRALEHTAKYKIYIHQDTFIVYKNMLIELIALFLRYPELGMIGLAGCVTVPSNGIWWEDSSLVGQVIEHRRETYQLLRFENGWHESEEYIRVQAIDGFFMATQVDVPWREDLFDGFHFYDTSQSLEIQRAGYVVGVPVVRSSWCIHYNGDDFDYVAYEKYRTIFVNNYFSDADHARGE